MPRRFVIRFFALACSTIVAASTYAGQQPSPAAGDSRPSRAGRDPLDGLGGYIEQAMKRWEIPGLAIAVVKDDRVVFSRGFGVREIGKPGAVTDETLFAMASQSKAFTATALGLLVAEEKLRWDDPATNHLPWFQLHDPYATRELTVRDLLCHRCGLGTWQGDLMWYGSDLGRREVLERVKFIVPESSFRYRYGYCNLTFVAAGEIIPAVAGVSWEDFLRRRFFDPMGMTRTNADIRELDRSENVARPHTMVKGKVVPVAYRSTRNTAPAGAINSCVRDWTRWLRLQLNEGTLDGRRIVPAEIVRETRTPQTLIPAKPEGDRIPFRAYGLGWALRDYEGRRLIAHSGGLDGMLSESILVPEEKLGVVVLTNYDEQEFFDVLPYHVLDAYLKTPHEDRESRILKARQEREKKAREDEAKPADGGRPSLPLAEYAGRYQHPVLGMATITSENGRLRIAVEHNPGLRGELEPWRHDTFRVEWADPYFRTSLIPFRLDERAKVDEFRMKVRPDFVDPMEYRFTRTP